MFVCKVKQMILLRAVHWAGVVALTDADTMVDWDEEKLEEVVKQKHAESDMKKPKTEIVKHAFESTSLRLS